MATGTELEKPCVSARCCRQRESATNEPYAVAANNEGGLAVESTESDTPLGPVGGDRIATQRGTAGIRRSMVGERNCRQYRRPDVANLTEAFCHGLRRWSRLLARATISAVAQGATDRLRGSSAAAAPIRAGVATAPTWGQGRQQEQHGHHAEAGRKWRTSRAIHEWFPACCMLGHKSVQIDTVTKATPLHQ